VKSCLTIQATPFILLRSPTPQTLFSRGRHLKTEEPIALMASRCSRARSTFQPSQRHTIVNTTKKPRMEN